MKTNFRKAGDMIIVDFSGHISFESNVPLRDHLQDLIKVLRSDRLTPRVIFNFEGLEFVGSSCISSFIQTLREFNSLSPTQPRYCRVASEFQKIIRAFDEEQVFAFYDDEERARRSFDQ